MLESLDRQLTIKSHLSELIKQEIISPVLEVYSNQLIFCGNYGLTCRAITIPFWGQRGSICAPALQARVLCALNWNYQISPYQPSDYFDVKMIKVSNFDYQEFPIEQICFRSKDSAEKFMGWASSEELYCIEPVASYPAKVF